MTSSEAARHDLYNGLTELLGPQRAETLMAALPTYDTTDLASKSDLMVLRTVLKAEMNELRAELRARMGAMETAVVGLQNGLVTINLRLDRLFLTLVGGLIVILGAMAGIVFMA